MRTRTGFVAVMACVALGCGGRDQPPPGDTVHAAPPVVARADSQAVPIDPASPYAYDWKRADSLTRRLPPDSFPAIPDVVRADMKRRGCTVPQNPDHYARKHNVISGALIQPGQVDWAVLCSIARASRILVYRSGLADLVDSIAEAPDADFLQSMGSPDKIHFSRMIDTVGKEYIEDHAKEYDGPKPPPIDHMGIDNIFSGKASVILYYYRGKWIALQGAD